MKRNGKKALAIILLSVVVALLLTSCKSKEPVTADVFKETVESLGYTAIDITEQYADYPSVLKSFGFEENDIHMEFLEIDNHDNATAFFNGNKAQIELYKGSASASSSVNMGSYQKYTLKASEKYYLVERVSTTFIYAYSDKSESEKLDNIIKALGY